jgi:hypothetical protein
MSHANLPPLKKSGNKKVKRKRYPPDLLTLNQQNIESVNLLYLVMAKKSRNNIRKTMGKFTTNPTQYLPLCNLTKYEHIYDKATGFITVKNIRQDRVVGVFDYPELCDYLRVRLKDILA